MAADWLALSGALWAGASLGHFLSTEESAGRRFLLKIFARWVEVPLLWFIWVVCRGPLSFALKIPGARPVLGTLVTRPFGLWMDTGVPVPTKDVMKMIDALDGRVAVGDCRCRLAKKTCDHPMRADIVFRTGAEAWLWAFPDHYREIGKEEAKKIVLECSEQDMFQMVFIHCSTRTHVNEYVLCNCCACGCKVHLLNRTMGQEYFPMRDGGFRSVHNPDKCERCGKCVEKCPFQAITLTDNGIRIGECFGCGLCERVCENGAYEVIKKLPGPDWSQEAWRALDKSELKGS